MKVAVLGASGFIGSRLVEILHLSGRAEVRPVVRSIRRLAGPARFALDGRVADGFDRAALAAALAGCDAVVHAIAGDRRTILGTAAAAYAAAAAAGVRRMVYLSSASVHGQSPARGTDEETPIRRRQPIPYNLSKAKAERLLKRLRARGSVELAILRPGIVYGPRSYWTAGLADELLAGQAYLVDSGSGICNGIYVDNLVHAIELSLTMPGADDEAFLVGDDETFTWQDLYRPLAEALGTDLTRIANVRYRAAGDPNSLPASLARRVGRRLPGPIRQRLRGAYDRVRASSDPLALSTPLHPTASLERALLHTCRYKLPATKAKARLGYRPPVSFEDGCRRAIAWLAFAGYPVVLGGSHGEEPDGSDCLRHLPRRLPALH